MAQSNTEGEEVELLESVPSWQLFLSAWGEWIAFSLGVLAAAAALAGWLADSKIAEIRHRESVERISAANLEAAKANARAAEANEKAEKERLERLKLEARLAPRKLSEQQITLFAERMTKWATLSSGEAQHVAVFASTDSWESAALVESLASALSASGWRVNRHAVTYGEPIMVRGVAIRPLLSERGSLIAADLAAALNEIGIKAFVAPPPSFVSRHMSDEDRAGSESFDSAVSIIVGDNT
tara:strand:+ start:2298 stop:3020 length:723 start_codon:yes stop_codon:yes gene_type:complete